LFSKTWWMSSHTPASCQSRSRRQQVMPHPQPISWGKSSQGMPVRRTNRMPVRVLRLSTGLRPGYRNRRRLGGGRMGSTNDQSSSVTISRAMTGPPCPVLPSASGQGLQQPFC
jgi:hypothetical protein